ncbi:hypothetical protein NE237_031459 [Protea cynaroides]|uniref:Uncharacterized protein n=1 Tax=Protea cynaroides TaxID=273540 RepID=A0A9Q0R2I7_9MAGN|nr:hypothetical protein NE237_031459 [Protea cynaroides]
MSWYVEPLFATLLLRFSSRNDDIASLVITDDLRYCFTDELRHSFTDPPTNCNIGPLISLANCDCRGRWYVICSSSFRYIYSLSLRLAFLHRLRKTGRSGDIVGAINAMLEHFKARMDLFTSFHTSSACPSPSFVTTGGYSIIQYLTVLNTIPDLDKRTYIKAMNHLTNNAKWRELFMSLDDEKKLWAIKSIPRYQQCFTDLQVVYI